MSIQFETVKFSSRDGFACNLKHVMNSSHTSRGPVLLVHGAGVSADIFNPPTKKNLIAMLMEEGYDVWLENWRASIDLPPNEWNLDQAALNDHPAAVQKVLEETGAKEIKAIIHCQGSTSFMISAVLGLIPEVKVIVSNAVSLHPVVPRFSVFKLKVLVPVVKLMFRYLNPQWGIYAPDFRTKMLRLLVKLTHPEDDTLVGKFVSFTYGTGFPALWKLENLDEKTKDWIQHAFAEVPLSFFDHIKKCVDRGVLVPMKSNGDKDKTYLSTPPKLHARLTLFSGEDNLCFLPQSQQHTYDYLESIQPNTHKLYIIKGYSHLDIFFGKNAHRDVFPLMIKALNSPKSKQSWPSPKESSGTGAATRS